MGGCAVATGAAPDEAPQEYPFEVPGSAHGPRPDAAVVPSSSDDETHGQGALAPTEAELNAVLSSSTVRAQLTGPMGQAPVTVQYRVEPGGPAWWWSTRGTGPTTGVGVVDGADLEVTCDAATARALLEGSLDVARAVLLGRVRLTGHLGALLGAAKPGRMPPPGRGD